MAFDWLTYEQQNNSSIYQIHRVADKRKTTYRPV